jgi:hypothetical protein
MLPALLRKLGKLGTYIMEGQQGPLPILGQRPWSLDPGLCGEEERGGEFNKWLDVHRGKSSL